jgi:hypothetical protein
MLILFYFIKQVTKYDSKSQQWCLVFLDGGGGKC